MAFEAGGKVATSTIDAMKSQPLAIALIVVNILFLGVGVYLIREVVQQNRSDRKERNEMTTQLMTNCGVKVINEIEELRMEIRGYIKPTSKG